MFSSIKHWFQKSAQPRRFQIETEEPSSPFQDVDSALLSEQLNRLRSFIQLREYRGYGFLILEPDQPIQGCEFVQTACDYGSKKFTIEARIHTRTGPRQYHRDTYDFDWLSSVFQQFLEGTVPDVSDWEEDQT